MQIETFRIDEYDEPIAGTVEIVDVPDTLRNAEEVTAYLADDGLAFAFIDYPRGYRFGWMDKPRDMRGMD